EVVSEAAVRKGRAEAIPLALREDLVAVVPRLGGAMPRLELEVQQGIVAPVKKGQALGRATLLEDGKVLAETTLVAVQDMPRATLFDYIYRGLRPFLRWVAAS
ncbi:MAG TPA: hypothetical protein VD902_21185, partial [Symbiobacteriaceae bacterium]|nr:hypothetical protein [Symbiobacteriaceae bacterium]